MSATPGAFNAAPPPPRGGGNIGCLPAIGVILLIIGIAVGKTWLFEKGGVPEHVIDEALQIRMRADPSVGVALCGPTTMAFTITRIDAITTQGNVHRGTGTAMISGARTEAGGVTSTCSGRVRFQYYSDRVNNDQVVQVHEIVPDH